LYKNINEISLHLLYKNIYTIQVFKCNVISIMKKPIPVTVISWYLWAWKTSLLKHLLIQKHNKKLAVIVNDMAEINIDSRLINNHIQLTQTQEKLVEMTNGCICCTLREDLLKEVESLCLSGDYDGIVIESTWVWEPLPVAQTFSYIDEETGIDLSKYAYIDTMVTVVDASTLLSYFYSDASLQDDWQALSEEDERSITQLFVDQIEFCNVCVVNKRSMIDEEQQKKVLWIIRSLQAEAKIITTDYSDVAIDSLIDTWMFDFDTASRSASRVKELEHEHIPETEEYGISSFTYEQKKPFHPQRLRDFLQQNISGLVRWKWFAWLASRPDAGLEWSFAWSVHTLWYGWRRIVSFLPEEIAMHADLQLTESYNIFKDLPDGDRSTQLVFIGIALDEKNIRQQLDSCLVTDEEKEQHFVSFDDPFEDVMKVVEPE